MDTSSFRQFLKINCPESEGIFYCLPKVEELNRIKKIEVETYSIRAEKFSEEKMLNLSSSESAILDPLRKLSQGSLILETGGGDGRFSFQLMKEGHQIIFSDIAPGSVHKVKQMYEQVGLQNGIFAVIDAENLPFKDGALDAIFMVASLHHLPDLKKAVGEFHRVLKPGGMLLVLHEPASWQYYIFYPLFKILRSILRYRNQNPISLADDVTFGFSPKKFKKVFAAQFTMVRITPVDYSKKYYTNYLLLKSKLLNKTFSGNQVLCAVLEKIDKMISKVPFMNYFPWDWDVELKKGDMR